MSKIKVVKLPTPERFEYNLRMNTDRDKVKFIKRVESIVRGSLENKDYISYLKEYVDMNHCSFYTKMENGNGKRIRIEVHHEPLTLYDIVETVVNRHQTEGIPLDDLVVADEVMELHYTNKVGLVPLSKSIHEMVHHSYDIFVPLQLVFGNYRDFLYDYDEYLSEFVVNKIENKIKMSKEISAIKHMAEILTPEYVYMDIEGYNLPVKFEISNNIKEIATA